MNRGMTCLAVLILVGLVGTSWSAPTVGYEVVGEELVTPNNQPTPADYQPTPPTYEPASAGYQPTIPTYQVVPAGYEVVPCRAECVKPVYHRGGSKCVFDRCDMHEVMVMVKDQRTCCCVEVPVCIPNCCTAICDIQAHPGIFGRCVYEYCWDCGFRMEIIATKHGDFIVHYYGVR